MNIHKTKTVKVLQRMVRTTIPQIGEQATKAYESMHAEAQERQLVINGAPIFVAQSMPQDAHTDFELTLCLPVEGKDLPTLPGLRCACFMFEGPLDKFFTHGYQTLLHDMRNAGISPSNQSREIYHAWYGPDSDKNRIEIQIGVAE